MKTEGKVLKLSYIVPVYKVEKYLRQCVDSILAQTMNEYEIILVDDGSPDNCPAICDEYKEKYPDIVKVIHKKNGGLPVARNIGLEVAKGEYVFFFDGDDYLIADGIAEIYNKAKHYNADVIQTSYFSQDEKTEKITENKSAFSYEKVYNHSDMEDMINNHMNKNILVYVWRNLYKTSFLKEKNIWSDEKLRTMQDAPFNMEAFLKADVFVAIDRPVYCYRLREGSIQRTKYIPDYDLFYAYQWEVKLRKYRENCRSSKQFYKDVAERNIKAFFPRMIRNYYANKIDNSYMYLKRIGNSEMMRRSFKDYDINEFKSNSLDWWMTWCMKYRLYPIAHLICKKVLYKSK